MTPSKDIAEFYSSLNAEVGQVLRKNKLGTLVMGELIECKKIPKSKDGLQKIMDEAAEILKVNVVARVFHEFNPHGLSGVLILAESHFSVHTWPEFSTVAVDIFSCSNVNPNLAIEFLKKQFGSKKFFVVSVPRGVGMK